MARHWTWTLSAALALATISTVGAQDTTPAEPAGQATEPAAPAQPDQGTTSPGDASQPTDSGTQGQGATSTEPSPEAAAGTGQAVELTCGDIAALGEAHKAALVYYVAGYVDATVAAGGTAASVPDNGMPGGLTLSAAEVIAACAEDADQTLADVIAGLGGSMAERTAESPATEEEPMAPADGDAMAPEDGTAAPADGTAAPGGDAMAPSGDAMAPSGSTAPADNAGSNEQPAAGQ